MAENHNPITARWKDGAPHDERSIALYQSLEKLDGDFGDDYFGFKSGGDGDNGEHLMYLLDLHFEAQDGEPEVLEIAEDFIEFRTHPGGYLFPGICRKAEEFLKAAGVRQTRIEGNNDEDWIRFYFEPPLTFEQAEELEETYG